MIDLRSDTLTVPCDKMRRAIAEAAVGDDVYGEDPTVNLLQEVIASYFGKEAALFVPSGTMSNQIALKILTEPGDEIIIESDAHIYYYETAAPSILSNLQLRLIQSDYGLPSLQSINKAIRPDVYYFPKTSVICLENTHNRHGGTILDFDKICEIKDFALEHNLKMHLDGARIWNTIVATGKNPQHIAAPFDTLSVCLSKSMGAPIGSLIISTKENIKKAWKWRKIFGGGMRQVGLLAAAGLFALNNNLVKLKSDHDNAKLFAESINKSTNIFIDFNRVKTNIVRFELANHISPNDFLAQCKKNNLLLSSLDGQTIRAVFYLNISESETKRASEIVLGVLEV